MCSCFYSRLQEEYPVWFEKPVLEIVHHNTVSLDKLVDLAWLEILTKYAVGEECDFLVRILTGDWNLATVSAISCYYLKGKDISIDFSYVLNTLRLH